MHDHKSIILFLTPRVMHITTVEGGEHPHVVHTMQRSWNWGSLSHLFSFIKTSIGDQHMRILLPDEFSHVLELKLPQTVQPSQERLYIQEQLASFIPEVLHTHDWDYKEITSQGTEKNVLIFAPLKIAYDAIYKAVQESELPIEAVEPVAIAGKRHKNPVIGLAIKKDLTGKDDEVLNIIPRIEPYQKSDGFIQETQPVPPYIWVLLSIMLLLLGIGVYLFFANTTPSSRSIQYNPPPAQNQPIQIPPSPTPTKVAEELDISSLNVRVLNGTGVPRASTQVASLLREKGFEKIATGNAEKFTYTKTIIRKKADISDQLNESLTQILSDYTVDFADPLAPGDPYDVVIVVGKKQK